MADKQHVRVLWKKPNHEQEEGCISSHEFDYWKPDYPNCAYRVKGRAEIMVNPGKMRLYFKKPEWAFIGKNYTVASTPFPHQYHHIMPSGVLRSKLENDELSILQASRYNINEGINLIILPQQADEADELQLPIHLYAHEKYSKECKTVIDTMKSDMSELTADGKHDITDANVDAFRAFLRRWEQEEFWLIVDYGKQDAARGVTPHINSGRVTMAR
ncbi:hypothetical protein CYFUS_008595 [Cystobacter fuscus]|uniref:Uncharacterized protein n=1 Tax=Cystobacter fuscus TaxID=43 RepID=A0A250JJ04_9BACT|nr:AHH domain-containing protein [Cystobacter fuscus]ATB43116.1 hypothetical protein CYFUS_008595 [Cystobacter fuscus]